MYLSRSGRPDDEERTLASPKNLFRDATEEPSAGAAPPVSRHDHQVDPEAPRVIQDDFRWIAPGCFLLGGYAGLPEPTGDLLGDMEVFRGDMEVFRSQGRGRDHPRTCQGAASGTGGWDGSSFDMENDYFRTQKAGSLLDQGEGRV